MIITHRHLRKFKYCNNGAREFFNRHGLDWTDFIKHGLDESAFIRTGDAMALKLVDFARELEYGRG